MQVSSLEFVNKPNYFIKIKIIYFVDIATLVLPTQLLYSHVNFLSSYYKKNKNNFYTIYERPFEYKLLSVYTYYMLNFRILRNRHVHNRGGRRLVCRIISTNYY